MQYSGLRRRIPALYPPLPQEEIPHARAALHRVTNWDFARANVFASGLSIGNAVLRYRSACSRPRFQINKFRAGHAKDTKCVHNRLVRRIFEFVASCQNASSLRSQRIRIDAGRENRGSFEW